MDAIRKIRPTCDPSPAVALSVNAARALLQCMKLVSLETWGVPWAPHLDRRLWREAHNPSKISGYDAAMLQWLCHSAGGWWSWNDDSCAGPTFVPLREWRLALMQRDGI